MFTNICNKLQAAESLRN